MARVPVVVENGVQLRPVTQERYQAVDQTAIGRTIGAGAQRLGQTMSEAANQQDQIDAMYDEARAKQLDNEYQAFERDLLFGEQGYYSKENADALNARQPTTQAINDQMAALMAKTQTGRERAMLGSVLQRRRDETLTGIGRYSLAQARNYAKVQSSARIDNATDNYIRFYSDPDRSKLEMGTIESEVRSQAALLGLQDAGVISAMMFDAKSKAHAGVVESRALDDPTGAMEYLEKHRDEIDPKTQLGLDRQLHPALIEHDARGIADMAEGVGTPGEVVQGGNGKPIVLASPIPGAKSSGYGWRKDPITGERKFHQGMDIPAAMGTRAGAAADGVVAFAGNRNDGYGNQVVVRHPDGTETRYAHLSEIDVRQGASVTRGAPVGKVGSTGRSTGPHLHFEVIDPRGNRMDPTQAVGRVVGRAGQQSQPQAQSDLGSQLAWVDAEIDRRYAGRPEGYREDVRAAARAEVERRWGMKRRVEAERFDNEADAAWRSVDALGDNFTSTGQIPNYGKLSPDAQHQFRVIARQNSERLSSGAGRKSDPSKWSTLSDAYAADPKAFLAIRPEQVRPFLDDGDFNTYLGWRRNAIEHVRTGGDGKTPEWLTESDVLNVSKTLLAAAGIATGDSKDARADAPKVRTFTVRMLDWSKSFKQQNGRLPNTDEIRRQADQMLVQGSWMDSNAWFFSTKGHAFERPDDAKDWRVEVPADIRRRIKAAAPNATEAEIQSIYTQGKGVKW